MGFYYTRLLSVQIRSFLYIFKLHYLCLQEVFFMFRSPEIYLFSPFCYFFVISLLFLSPRHIIIFINLQYTCAQNVNPIVAQDWVSGMQRLILKKEEEIKAADRCRIQLQLPGKHDKFVFYTLTHFYSAFQLQQTTWTTQAALRISVKNLIEDKYTSWCCSFSVLFNVRFVYLLPAYLKKDVQVSEKHPF